MVSVDVSVKLEWMVSVAKGRGRERPDIGIEKERVELWVLVVSRQLPCCGLVKERAGNSGRRDASGWIKDEIWKMV